MKSVKELLTVQFLNCVISKKVNFSPIFSFLYTSLFLLFIVKGGKRQNILLIVTFLVFLDLKIVFALL